MLSQVVTHDERILPTTQDSFLNTIQNELPLGQYWVNVKETNCENDGFLTFNILELGKISDRGELIRIDNQPWANTNDIVRIAAIFKNVGSRVVNAKFKGTIEKDGKVVEVIDTDSLNVRPQQTSELETFFNARESGQYEVKGRVIYNSKLTFEKTSVINVENINSRITGGVVAKLLKNPYQIAMSLILLAIITLIYMIQKEKKRRGRF